MSLARNLLRKGLMPVALVLKDRRRAQPMNCWRRGRSLARGFISESTLLYGINHSNHKHYLSDLQVMKTGRINGAASVYLNNKIAFVDLLESMVEMPETLAIIKDGQFISRRNQLVDVAHLLTRFRENPDWKVVIKPIAGAEGRGVAVLQSGGDGHVLINDEFMTEKEFLVFVSELDDYFISEFIQQGEFAHDLFPDSLNTIRMLSMVNPLTQRAFIAGSVFRVGTQLSEPTDNFRRFGLSVAIDDATGRLGKAAMIPRDGKVNWYEVHPDTGAQLTGLEIPHWNSVKENILAVADYVYRAKQISYVGWDVVLTDEGISLLEGNSWPGVSLHQVHQGLLVDPEVRLFYGFVGAVK